MKSEKVLDPTCSSSLHPNTFRNLSGPLKERLELWSYGVARRLLSRAEIRLPKSDVALWRYPLPEMYEPLQR